MIPRKVLNPRSLLLIVTALLLATLPATASAHVKWFSEFSFQDRPLTLSEIATPLFFALALLSIAVVSLMVWLDRRLEGTARYQRLNAWFAAYRDQSQLIMRVAMGAVLLISWSSDAMLAPELAVRESWIGWFQFLLVLLLLFRRTTPIAGFGLILLYFIGLGQFTPFHMLDYVYYLGIGYFLIVGGNANPTIRESALPALFATVGFSLCWLGLEKLVYPTWGLYLLEQNPQLTLGLDPRFFLVSAAFVEFSLGYLLIIGLLERPLALIITAVFFTTTMVFGKLEIIGHTPLHAALIIFLINGPGTVYKPPIALHRRLNWRTAFAAVNFALLLLILSGSYTYAARQQFDLAASGDGHEAEAFELSGAEIPQVELIVSRDDTGAYILHVGATNFQFTPENLGTATTEGTGHAHLFVNGEEVARLYSPWYDLGELEPGQYQFTVVLDGNDHTPFTVGGEYVMGELDFTAEAP